MNKFRRTCLIAALVASILWSALWITTFVLQINIYDHPGLGLLNLVALSVAILGWNACLTGKIVDEYASYLENSITHEVDRTAVHRDIAAANTSLNGLTSPLN